MTKQTSIQSVTRSAAINALEDMFKQASDIPYMTLDEINAEIVKTRALRKLTKEK